MKDQFYEIRFQDFFPWIMKAETDSYILHEDHEFRTSWKEPTGEIGLCMDEEDECSFWADIIGCGGSIIGLYVSELVKQDWEKAGINYGQAYPGIIRGSVPPKLRKIKPPIYYWIGGHIGACIDYEKSGYKIIGQSEATGKTYVSPVVKPKCIAFVENSWDGSDLFVTGFPPTRFFCTKKIVEIAAKNKRTNFCFVPIENAADVSHPGIKYL